MNFVSLSAASHPAARHSDVQHETANCDARDNTCNVCAVHCSATAHRGLVRHAVSQRHKRWGDQLDVNVSVNSLALEDRRHLFKRCHTWKRNESTCHLSQPGFHRHMLITPWVRDDISTRTSLCFWRETRVRININSVYKYIKYSIQVYLSESW